MELTPEILDHRINWLKQTVSTFALLSPDTEAEINAIRAMALAHLAAKERSVQGWAILNAEGKIIAVTICPLVGDQYKPVTITINAAGQERNKAGAGVVPDLVVPSSGNLPNTSSAPVSAAPLRELWLAADAVLELEEVRKANRVIAAENPPWSGEAEFRRLRDALRAAGDTPPVTCPRCYAVVTKSCGPNCAWDWEKDDD